MLAVTALWRRNCRCRGLIRQHLLIRLQSRSRSRYRIRCSYAPRFNFDNWSFAGTVILVELGKSPENAGGPPLMVQRMHPDLPPAELPPEKKTHMPTLLLKTV